MSDDVEVSGAPEEPGRAEAPRERRKRDGLVIGCTAISVLCMVIVSIVGSSVLHNRSSVVHIQEGRRLGVLATCGINKSIIAAGRDAIQGGILLPGDQLADGRFIPGPLTRSLGPHYPTYQERLDRAQMAANAYEQRIVGAVVATLREQKADNAPVAHGADGRLHLSCTESLKVSGLK